MKILAVHRTNGNTKFLKVFLNQIMRGQTKSS